MLSFIEDISVDDIRGLCYYIKTGFTTGRYKHLY